MKKMIWFTIASVLFLIFIVPTVLATTLKMIPSGDQPGYDSNQRLSIYGGRGVSQKFISRVKNLTAVGTSIRNPNLKNKKEIIFSLYDENEPSSTDKKLVRTSILNGQNFQDGDFVKFVFEPIPESLNKTYLFTIFSPGAGPEETVEVFYFTSPTKDILDYTYDEKTYPGGLPIVTFRKPGSKWEVIKDVYSNLFSRFLHLDSQKS